MSNLSDEELGLPTFEDLLATGMQELFRRMEILENVLVDAITIVADTADQPYMMSGKMRALLAPPEPEAPEEG